MVTKCDFKDCQNRAAKIIGDCKACKQKWCLNHRLPEDHNCAQLDAIRQKSFEQNMNKLMTEKTHNKKI